MFLVVSSFELVEVLEGHRLEDGVDGMRVEALADAGFSMLLTFYLDIRCKGVQFLINVESYPY
jgi:hypothetical protein